MREVSTSMLVMYSQLVLDLLDGWLEDAVSVIKSSWFFTLTLTKFLMTVFIFSELVWLLFDIVSPMQSGSGLLSSVLNKEI